jgi:hypothetical protein
MSNARLDRRRTRLADDKTECLRLMSDSARQTYQGQILPSIRFGEPFVLLGDIWTVDYRCKPVTLREFVTNEYFLGRSLRDSVYPRIVDDLEELFEGSYGEVVLSGSQAWGKTVFATIGILYDIYALSCLKDPAAAFGQIPGSAMAFVNVSVRKAQAMRVFFGGICNLINDSPYFTHDFPFRRKLRSELQFYRGSRTLVRCYPVTANEQSVLGEFIFSAVMDEVNFYDLIEHSKRLRPGDSGVFNQAAEVYNRLSVRIRGRLNQRGRLPGHLWIISSARYADDFVTQKEREAAYDREIFVRRYAQWETKPARMFTCNPDGTIKTFAIEEGGLTRRPRILQGNETDVNPANVVHVPIDLRPAFERDLDRALRDLAGRGTQSITPFIGRPEAIRRMFEAGKKEGLRHPLNHVDAEGRPLDVTLQETLGGEVRFVAANLHMVSRSTKDLYARPVETQGLFSAMYYAHVDLSKNHDASGICVGHVVGVKAVERFDDKTHQNKKEKLPVIRIDLVLRVVPPHRGEIDIARIRGLFYHLSRYGMEFGKITYDQFQSQESVKALKDQGYISEVFSVDSDPTAYGVLKRALYDERVLCYDCPKLETELARLEWVGSKVDHPSVANSSKDLADCLAAVVYHCEEGWRSTIGSKGMFRFGSMEPDWEPFIVPELTVANTEPGTPLAEEELDRWLFGPGGMAGAIAQGLIPPLATGQTSAPMTEEQLDRWLFGDGENVSAGPHKIR